MIGFYLLDLLREVSEVGKKGLFDPSLTHRNKSVINPVCYTLG